MVGTIFILARIGNHPKGTHHLTRTTRGVITSSGDMILGPGTITPTTEAMVGRARREGFSTHKVIVMNLDLTEVKEEAKVAANKPFHLVLPRLCSDLQLLVKIKGDSNNLITNNTMSNLTTNRVPI